MPPRIIGEPGPKMPANQLEDMFDVNYDYNYPRGLDLKPGSEFHEKLRSMIWDRAWDSRRVMANKYDDWREKDRVLKSYVPAERNALRVDDDNDDEDPLTRIVMPVTFANKETLLTYMFSAFLQDPIFKYEGTGPEDAYGAFLMTHHIARQCHRSRMGLALNTQWGDAFTYGFGVVSPVWYREEGMRVVPQDSGFLHEIMNLFIITDRKRKLEKATLWEGNKLINIDPYRFFPDPNTPIHEEQEAEYVGWLAEDNFIRLMRRERDKDDFLFNVKYLKHLHSGSSQFSHVFANAREDDTVERKMTSSNHPVDVLYMYVDLIPQEWKLGRGKYPEKWLFMVAADQVIVAAQPLGLAHGRFPVAVAAPTFDGYSVTPPSLLDTTMDLQILIDFLYSSHIANIRKSINDMIVVDPSMINIHDINNPKPGKIIRTRRSTFGRGGVDAHIKQLVVQDITAGNVQEAQFLMNFMREVHGTSEGLSGLVARRSDRVSAQEARDSRLSGLARLERYGRIISMQSMLDIAYMLAVHTQQFAEEETYIKVMGEWPERLKNEFGAEVDQDRLYIDPLDMLVDFDLEERDGTIPGSEDVQTWVQVMQMAGQMGPQVLDMLNLPKLFVHIARHLGAKNPEDFILRAEARAPVVMDDEQVLQEADRGNLVPLEPPAQAA